MYMQFISIHVYKIIIGISYFYFYIRFIDHGGRSQAISKLSCKNLFLGHVHEMNLGES